MNLARSEPDSTNPIVFALGIVLPNFFVLQRFAAHYLMFAAVMLAMKQYAAWYIQGQFLRGLMDMRNTGPIIAKLVDNSATDEDLANTETRPARGRPGWAILRAFFAATPAER